MQSFVDLTGDGRPDLIYHENGKLWIARNLPGPAGTTRLGTPAQLNDSMFTRPFLDARSSTAGRFNAHRNQDYLWTQTIDVNGDGRLDIIDAAEKPNHWVIYLNTPDAGPSGVKWVRRAYHIGKLYDLLVARGHYVESQYVPLSKRETGSEYSALRCFHWDSSTDEYVPADQYLGTLCPLNDVNHDGSVDSKDALPYARGPQETYVVWEVKDVNGDGYPDVVFNSSPMSWEGVTSLPTHHETDYYTSQVQYRPTRVGPNPSWGVEMVLNVHGLFIADDVNGTAWDPFSAAKQLIQSTGCGVGLWTGPHPVYYPNEPLPDIQTAICDITDINGDGLADRVDGTNVMLGTGDGFSAARIILPSALAKQDSEFVQTCTPPPPPASPPPPLTPFSARQTRALRDVTGDGIPDFIKMKDGAGYQVYVGTGAGFGCSVNGTSVSCPPPIDIEGSFDISRVEETCDGTRSRTKSGLYDVDGDGTPERLLLAPCYSGEPNCTAWKLDVFPLVGGSAPGRPEAGRIVQIDNGYGARTSIAYRSAKQDGSTLHQVPFPEIVVDSIETTDMRMQGGTLTKTSYAYGSNEMYYDSIADAFQPTGYLRRIDLQTASTSDYPQRQVTATVVDSYPLEPFNPTLSSNARLGRYLRVGRTKDITVLAGDLNSDPWSLLTVNVNTDAQRIGQTQNTIELLDTKMWTDATSAVTGCMDVMYPYNYDASKSANAGQYNLCTTRGSLHTNATKTWRGSAAPPLSYNVQTRSKVLAVDDFGRVTSTLHQNDLFRTEDDVCVDVTYATPTGTDKRVLSSMAARKVWGGLGCGNGEGSALVYWEEAWEYDKLPYPVVSEGLVTAHTVYRRATDTGQWLGTIREYDVDYNVTGNPIRIVQVRDGDYATRTTSMTWDAFGLAPIDTSVSGTNVPTLTSHGSVDSISLERYATEDPNGTIRARTYDGFGRPLVDHVVANGVAGVLATRTYQGFYGTQFPERRVVVKEFPDPVNWGAEATAEGRTTTTFFDELGRPRHTHVDLGDDYANEMLVVSARKYDGLGRVVFEADPYPLSENASTAYGTTQYYNADGSLWLSVRGRGRQAFSTTPDASLERFPTLYERSFTNFTETVSVKRPDELTLGLAQYGVSHREEVTAVGRVVSRSTWQGSTRLEFAEFAYDRLGQQTKMIRFQDASNGALPVEWSWKLDSLGQVRWLFEPSSTPQERTYSSFGELKQLTWTPPSPEPVHSIVKTYDAFGRLTQTVEQNGGVDAPDTSFTYGYDVPNATPLVTPTGVLGRLSVAKAASGDVVFSYDGLGRVNAKTHIDQTGVYYERHGMHANGSQAWIELNLPDNNYVPERVDYAYDSAGRLQSMWSTDGANTQQLYNAWTVDPWGRVRVASFGQTTRYEAGYANVGRRLPTVVSLAGGEETEWGRMFYFNGFDPVERELARKEYHYDGGSSFDRDDDYTAAYDRLGRLQTSRKTRYGNTLGLSSFQYDPIGNIQFHRDHVGTTDAWFSYQATDRDRICRIGYGDGGLGGTACNVEYDSFGNILFEPTRNGYNTLRYYNSGAVRSIENALGATASFRYDAFGAVKELDIVTAGTTERSERRYGEFIVKRTQRGSGGITTYTSRQFPGPEVMISRRGRQGPWIYQFSESRGTRVTTDQQGNFVQDVAYAPYGQTTSSGAQPGTAEFSNEQWNEGDALAPFGLVHLGARIYDPAIGRFLSRDPLLIPRTASTSNPYAFAFNDPINFADPSGLDGEGSSSVCFVVCITPGTPLWGPYPWQGSGGGGRGRGGGGGGGSPDEPRERQNDQRVIDFAVAWVSYGLLYEQLLANAIASSPDVEMADDSPSETNTGLAILEGAGGALIDMGSGIVDMVTSPRQTAKGLWFAASHPYETAKGIANGLYNTGKALATGNAEQKARAFTQLAANIVPGKMMVGAGTTVYRSVSRAAKVQYVGITNNLARRAAEHLRTKGIYVEKVLDGLSRSDARAVEQALIEIHNLGKNGGTLMNKINSIATTNPIYAKSLRRGQTLLNSIGYK